METERIKKIKVNGIDYFISIMPIPKDKGGIRHYCAYVWLEKALLNLTKSLVSKDLKI